MLAERRMPEDLADRIDALARAWNGDPDLAAIYLFGSRAGGRGGPRSDVDLAVVLRGELDAAARWRKRLALLGDACQRLGTDAVDLVVLEDAPAPVGHRVLKGGRLLREPLPQRRADVAERILRCYLDAGGAARAAPAQACADIALHILAGTGTAVPETYAEALSALAADAVIPGPLGARLAQAVRLRNILVHGYLDIDHAHWLEQNVDR